MTRMPFETYAYYLPQFYPVDLNSQWWGEGYTEWNALLKAQRGWRLPPSCRLAPGQLGFYDLRNKEVRRSQGDLARKAGLSAFALYHYWSNGDRPLNEVEDLILSDGQPEHPFFFFWANHDWTLAWAGQPSEVTFEQKYSDQDDSDHIAWMARAFADPRYRKLRGMPIIGVFRPLDLPDPAATFAVWRLHAKANGYPGLVILGASHEEAPPGAAEEYGLSAWIQTGGPALAQATGAQKLTQVARSPAQLLRFVAYRDRIVSPEQLRGLLRKARRGSRHPLIPMVYSSWGNAGRRLRRAWHAPSDPVQFGLSLTEAMDDAPRVEGAAIVMINAWNEWGEMMTLEPSVEHADGMLDTLHDVVARRNLDPKPFG